MTTLRLLSRGSALCADLEAHANGVRRFVGRKHDRTVGFMDKDGSMSGGWPSTGEAQEVPARGEYAKACRDGDLWPADEATAAYCGVRFDPDFGGEHAVVSDSSAS